MWTSTLICIFVLIWHALFAVDLGKICHESGVLLDCQLIDGDGYYESFNQDVTRVVFSRLTGKIDMKTTGLKTVIVNEGMVDCNQLLHFQKPVKLNEIICDVTATHYSVSTSQSEESTSQNTLRVSSMSASSIQVSTMSASTMQDSTTQTIKQVVHSDEWSHNVIIMTIIPAVIMSLVIIIFIIVKVIKLVKRRRRRNLNRDLPLATLSASRISSSSETVFEMGSTKTD